MGRRAVLNTLTVLILLSNLLICSTIVLESKKQILNHYESLTRMRILEIKLYESEVNIAISFLKSIDKIVNEKQTINYNEVLSILIGKTISNTYIIDDYIINVVGKASLSDLGGFDVDKLNGLPTYQGTTFVLNIFYFITNNLGEKYTGRERATISYPVDFRKLLESIDNGRKAFEGEVIKHNLSSDTLQSILTNSILYVQESLPVKITLMEIRLENNSARIFYKVSLSALIQNFLDRKYVNRTIYQDFELIANLRQE
ncbi:MAG: hypothetical protein QXJ17_05365 [Nitrososphaeria archaeon]